MLARTHALMGGEGRVSEQFGGGGGDCDGVCVGKTVGVLASGVHIGSLLCALTSLLTSLLVLGRCVALSLCHIIRNLSKVSSMIPNIVPIHNSPRLRKKLRVSSLAYVGLLNTRKGFDLFLDAAVYLAKKQGRRRTMPLVVFGKAGVMINSTCPPDCPSKTEGALAPNRRCIFALFRSVRCVVVVVFFLICGFFFPSSFSLFLSWFFWCGLYSNIQRDRTSFVLSGCIKCSPARDLRWCLRCVRPLSCTVRLCGWSSLIPVPASPLPCVRASQIYLFGHHDFR